MPAKNTYYVTASCWVEAEDEGAAESIVEDGLNKLKDVVEIDEVEAEEEEEGMPLED